MRRVLIVGLSALLLRMASAQAQPDLVPVLKKVSEIYRAATQYEFVGDATCRVRPPGTTETVHFRIAFQSPNKYHMQAGIQCIGPGNGDMGQAFMVLDGSVLWMYFQKMNRYASLPASALSMDAAGDLGELRPDFVDRATMWRYRGMADVADKVTFLREESINIMGAKVACYVVVIPPQEHLKAQTWWIDKATAHVLRMDDDDSSTVFTSVKLNTSLPDDLFKFTPPPNAQKMELDQ